MAPTYFRREPGIKRPDGHRGSALSGLKHILNHMQTTSPAASKAELRRAVLARRDALPAAERAAAAELIAGRGLPVRIEGAVVSGFMPIKSEINPLPLMRKLAAAGAGLALPAVDGPGRALIMRAWSFGEPLAAGVWGIREPKPQAPVLAPDILIVPLLAFDRAGHRIGYGAGYYDLTIAALRAKQSVLAVGIAFAAQEIAAVPATPRDARLDLVLTEREVIDCGTS
jgi:5-formyltetrahydrofolate cyclo-ligase